MVVEEVHVKFQGGFTGKTCVLQAGNSLEDLRDLCTFYPEDISSKQVSNITLSMLINLLMSDTSLNKKFRYLGYRMIALVPYTR